MLLYFILCFINVHLKIAVFCTRFTKDGTKECLSHYYLYGDICTGIANAFILSKHLYCINTYMYSFHNYKHARYDSQNVLLDIMKAIAPYPVPHQLMETTVLKNVLVLVLHVTMSMDATKQQVGKIYIFFNLEICTNIQMNSELQIEGVVFQQHTTVCLSFEREKIIKL